MLTRLSVDNYALIDKLEIAFDNSLNIITGETGSGKSILLGALGLILGARADSSAIRDTSRNCVVEAEFDIEGYGLEPLFAELDIDYEPHTTVRRVINPAGKSRAYVNDLPVQLTSLREIGDRLIDIHSQYQTLLVGESRFQTGILDSVASDGRLLSEYSGCYGELEAARKEYGALSRSSGEAAKELDLIRHQFDELSAAGLKPGEQEEVEAQLSELEHASEIRETLGYAATLLDGGESNMLTDLKGSAASVGRLQEFYPPAGEMYARLNGCYLELKDIASEISAESERIEANDELMQRLSDRVDLFYSLQQKHRVRTVGELIEIRDGLDRKLQSITNADAELAALKERIAALETKARDLAGRITTARTKAAPEVEKYVAGVLAELGMPSARLRVDIAPAGGFTPNGADRVAFMFTANKGSELQPLEKVASGGEMSRLMLALKSLIADRTGMPTVIFDEIDTGVSGNIADRMGDIINRMSGTMQVINITHLPQVASKGRTHFLVYKEESPAGTRTFIRRLGDEERVSHIASMLSGSRLTDAAVAQARLLLSGK